jgi:RNA polymerase sigma factor (TIGR02999 family)
MDPSVEPDAAATGAGQSADVLFDAVYSRLKAMAGRQLAHEPAQASLDTTALVHELYLRLSTNRELAFSHPAQFFAYAARAMRHLLRDRARDRLRQRAGGSWLRMTLNGDEPIAITSAEQALALDEALERLAQTDPRAEQVVEMRYFAGLSLEQVAETLGVARRTIDRDWRFARAFLHDQLG